MIYIERIRFWIWYNINTSANLILNLNIEVSGWIIDAPVQPLLW